MQVAQDHHHDYHHHLLFDEDPSMLEVDAFFSTLDQFKSWEEQAAAPADEAQSPEAIVAHDHHDHGFDHYDYDYHPAAVQIEGMPEAAESGRMSASSMGSVTASPPHLARPP